MSSEELTDVVTLALALLAVVVQVALALLLVLAAAALFWRPARRRLAALRDGLGGSELWLAWIVALTATLGSMFFSEVSHFIPCRLCWYQRIAMYPLSVILLVSALRRDVRVAFWYAFVFPLVGAGVAIYHLYIEANPDAESTGCKIGAPCSTKWIDKFGYITMPGLALTAFAAIFALLLLGWSRRERRERTEPQDEQVDESQERTLD